MLGQKKDTKKIFSVTLLLFGIAVVFSLMTTVFASDSKDEVASFRTMSTAIIKGSENVPEISLSKFLTNTVENTGIAAIVSGSEEVEDLFDASQTTTIPG